MEEDNAESRRPASDESNESETARDERAGIEGVMNIRLVEDVENDKSSDREIYHFEAPVEPGAFELEIARFDGMTHYVIKGRPDRPHVHSDEVWKHPERGRLSAGEALDVLLSNGGTPCSECGDIVPLLDKVGNGASSYCEACFDNCPEGGKHDWSVVSNPRSARRGKKYECEKCGDERRGMATG